MQEALLIQKKPIPGVRFEPGTDAKPLEWTMFVEAPVGFGLARHSFSNAEALFNSVNDGACLRFCDWVTRCVQEEYTVVGSKRKCPYAGRVFPVYIKFPHNYPFKCPEMHFKPGLLYHPNVNKDTGEAVALIIVG